jgi:hypothetical protein
MIDQQLRAFAHDGVGVHIGTRNEQFEPNGARAISVRVDEDGKRLIVYMSAVGAKRILPDLESNGMAAVVLARPRDERACQIKGTFVASRPVDDAERASALAQWNAFLESLEFIGIPARAAATWINIADVAIELKVTAIFEQTPGPQAGQPLA